MLQCLQYERQNRKTSWGGGSNKRSRLKLKKHFAIISILSLAIITSLPPTVQAIQNIFLGLGQIEDIRFDGAWIDQVVYQGEILWERPPHLQELTAMSCPTTRTMAIDARNSATYWVRKVGNFCMMETNLAYAGGGHNTYGDATTPITQGTTNADYTLTAARYFIPPGANPTFRPDTPSTATDGTAQYGYLYNFCAAMNGNPDACQRPDIQPDQSINGGTPTTLHNICPKGWRLPIRAELASYTYAPDPTNVVPDLLANGLYTFSGTWINGGFSQQGEVGYYRSSEIATNNNYATRALQLFASGTANSNPYYKTRGLAIRCLAP